MAGNFSSISCLWVGWSAGSLLFAHQGTEIKACIDAPGGYLSILTCLFSTNLLKFHQAVSPSPTILLGISSTTNTSVTPLHTSQSHFHPYNWSYIHLLYLVRGCSIFSTRVPMLAHLAYLGRGSRNVTWLSLEVLF